MRKLPVFALALVLGIAAMGCDSEEDLTDAEILVGSWTVVEVSDDEGDKTDVFEEGINDFSATIHSNGDYELSVDFVDPQRTDYNFENTYELNEGANRLILHVVLPTGAVELPFEYDIESEDRLDLAIGETFVESVFGTDPATYDGEVVFTVERD